MTPSRFPAAGLLRGLPMKTVRVSGLRRLHLQKFVRRKVLGAKAGNRDRPEQCIGCIKVVL